MAIEKLEHTLVHTCMSLYLFIYSFNENPASSNVVLLNQHKISMKDKQKKNSIVYQGVINNI